MIVHFPVHAILNHHKMHLIDILNQDTRNTHPFLKSKPSNNESLKWSDKKLDVPLLEWKNETPFKLEIPNW